jgi:hypothetical protein
MFQLCLLLCTAMPIDAKGGESPLTTLRQSTVGEAINLSWNDTEELLKGVVTPAVLRAGQSVTISVSLARYDQGRFSGPVTISLQPLAELGGGGAVTVPAPSKGERMWAAKVTPLVAGPHRLEIAWTSTHRKVVRGVVTVEDARLPFWLPWAVGGTAILMAVALGAWLVLRREGAA